MVSPLPKNANDFIEEQLDQRARDLEKTLGSHVLSFSGDIIGGVDDRIRSVVERRKSEGKDCKKLTMLVTTLGGYIEVVQRIVDTLRHNYDVVDFVVPNYAFSAGTVLVMSGDAIWMDYYSRLGPIDPQVASQSGKPVPATGYLRQWERLIQKAKDGKITLPEIQLMIQGFDQAELYSYEQQRELSIALLKEWLTKYKFKNWTKTATRGVTVTDRMRKARASKIAKQLSNTERWHVHSYGISMDVLREEMNLLIDDFGSKPKPSTQIKGYYGLLDDYMVKMGHEGVLHTAGIYLPFVASE